MWKRSVGVSWIIELVEEVVGLWFAEAINKHVHLKRVDYAYFVTAAQLPCYYAYPTAVG